MRVWRLFTSALPFGLWMLILFGVPSAKSLPPAANETAHPQIFSVKGVVQSINRDERQLVIRHEAISNYMAAMAMPFKIKTTEALAGFQNGDEIPFQLHVTETESWGDQIVKTGTASPPPPTVSAAPAAPADLLEQIWRPFIPLARVI
jgi:Cu/Ag efflux protein CusF